MLTEKISSNNTLPSNHREGNILNTMSNEHEARSDRGREEKLEKRYKRKKNPNRSSGNRTNRKVEVIVNKIDI